jgi:acetyl esterase/lipase
MLVTLGSVGACFAAEQQFVKNIPYYAATTIQNDAYAKQRALLDVYYPESQGTLPTIVWFHGGGLSGGEKHIPKRLKIKVCVLLLPIIVYLPRLNHPYTLKMRLQLLLGSSKISRNITVILL